MDLDYTQVVERFGPSLYRLAFSYCRQRQDAEDVVQEVMIKYLNHGRRFGSEAELRHWLFKVTANQCRDLLRSAWKTRTVPLDGGPDLPAENRNRDEHLALEQAMDRLDPKYRAVLYLYYYEDLPVEQVARILSLTGTAVRSRLDRGRKQLRALLGGDWNEG